MKLIQHGSQVYFGAGWRTVSVIRNRYAKLQDAFWHYQILRPKFQCIHNARCI